MYNASELFIIKDVLEIYTQQKQNNECMFITTCLESRAADYHKVKKFTEFVHLQCMTAGSSRMFLA